MLLTKRIIKDLPRIGGTGGIPFPERVVVARFVDKKGLWRWFVIEGEECDGDWELFGMVVGTGVSYEYFKLNTLEEMETVIRDVEWRPKKLREVSLL